MRKLYKKLTDEQKERGVVFSSCLSRFRTECKEDLIHEVLNDDDDIKGHIMRLLDDNFFNASEFNYNIIRE